MKITPSLVLFFSFAFFCAPGALPLSADGVSGAPILNRPVGSRSSGMGRAFAGIYGDQESLMYNPAGLGFSPGGAYIAHMNGFGGGGYGFGAVSLKTGDFVLTPAFLYYNSGSIDLNLSDGTKGSVTAELDKVVMLSAAYVPVSDLAVGGTLKFTSLELAETASASVKHFDLGVLYKFSKGLSFGASSMNNGEEIKFESEGDPAPAALRAGAAYKYELNPPNLLDRSAEVYYSDIVLTADWSKIKGEEGYYQSGFEMNMQMAYSVLLSVRVGYLFNREEEGMTFGFGLKNKRWSFGLGFESGKDFDPRRPISVSYEF